MHVGCFARLSVVGRLFRPTLDMRPVFVVPFTLTPASANWPVCGLFCQHWLICALICTMLTVWSLPVEQWRWSLAWPLLAVVLK